MTAWHVVVATAAWAAAAPCPAREPDAVRQAQLVRLVRQDCGSCHGMRLTGGLGPPLTPEALAARTTESVASTIVHGRPGTPMPPWRALLDEDEARWIAQRLRTGLPDRQGDAR